MHNDSQNIVSKQAQDIYNLLAAEGSLSAATIAGRLNILPNAVYRAARQLVAVGIVKKTASYPVRFTLLPSGTVLPWYLLQSQKAFLTSFPVTANDKSKKNSNLNMSFVKDRQSLLERTDTDTSLAQKSINFIVSGLEVPDSTVLAYRKAAQNGVNIRALIQKRSETHNKKLERWQTMGVSIRLIDSLDLRLFIFDSKIVYFTSYSQQIKEQALGIRFNYAPIAAVMNGLFEEKWAQAA